MFPEKFDTEAGEIILVDKPLGWTSFDAVNFVKRNSKQKSGHAGTLDPLATGLLIVCTGKKTKIISTFQDREKVYSGTITLGQTSPSFDLETEVTGGFPISHLQEDMIREKAGHMQGVHEQAAPVYSAKRIGGKRSYDIVRAGGNPEPKICRVEIREMSITAVRFLEGKVEADFLVTCSKGTYIRALARDFALALGTEGLLTALRREKIGDYSVAEAHSPEALKDWLQEARQSSEKQ